MSQGELSGFKPQPCGSVSMVKPMQPNFAMGVLPVVILLAFPHAPVTPPKTVGMVLSGCFGKPLCLTGTSEKSNK